MIDFTITLYVLKEWFMQFSFIKKLYPDDMNGFFCLD